MDYTVKTQNKKISSLNCRVEHLQERDHTDNINMNIKTVKKHPRINERTLTGVHKILLLNIHDNFYPRFLSSVCFETELSRVYSSVFDVEQCRREKYCNDDWFYDFF